ncbi:MAG: hypothetical protein J5I98_01415 [Phaeodactylibacter sp.]|nr:hypothetical protein [Phaeodactylibacter sp.]
MKRFLFLLALLPNSGFGQTCSCSDNLEWVIKTFTENDAGAQATIESKGEQAFQEHNEKFREKVKKINDLRTCTPVLYEWLLFFRSGHLGIQLLDQSSGGQQLSEEEAIEKYRKERTYPVSVEAFEEEMTKRKEPGFEGVWASSGYKIGIKKEGENYMGFIIEADGVYWHERQVKLEIFPAEAKGQYKASYYMRDHSLREFPDVKLVGNNFLQAGFTVWERVSPQQENDAAAEAFAKDSEILAAQSPFVRKLSDRTALIRISSFAYEHKSHLDSILSQNHETITNSENLIIDLRNNGGGSDESFYGLIPYLYTNPIRVIGLEYYASPGNMQFMQSILDDPESPGDWKEWAGEILAAMKANPGQFVTTESEQVYVEKRDTVYSHPNNVAILINKGCASTTEQFLLAARQSKKVKLFGTSTFGALDISNQAEAPSPCNEFNLVYCLTRSKRIPEMAIDEVGIQPDHYLDPSIPEYEWIDFARGILER